MRTSTLIVLSILFSGPSFSQDLVTYTAADKSFKFVYPKEWNLEENKNGFKAFVSKKEKKNSTKYQVQIYVSVIPAPSPHNYLSRYRSEITDAVAALPNGKIKSLEEKTLGKYPGLLVDYSQTESTQSKDALHIVAWLIVRDDQLYLIKYLAIADWDQDHLQQGLAVIDSFDFPNMGMNVIPEVAVDPKSTAQTYKVGEEIEVNIENNWKKATILAFAGTQEYVVRFKDPNLRVDEVVSGYSIRKTKVEAGKQGVSQEFFSLSRNDYASALLGEWTGRGYIGQKPVANRISGGVGGPAIYDSTEQQVQIQKVTGNRFYGVAYGYIPTDPDNNFYLTNIEGWIEDSTVHIKSTLLESKLTKYPGRFWCNSESDLKLTSDNLAFYFRGISTSSGCIAGYSDLRKLKIVKPPEAPIAGKENASSNTSEVAQLRSKYFTRQKHLAQSIKVASPEVELRFYDNAQIDGDSISVFVNGELIAAHQKLQGSAVILKIPFPSTITSLEVGMFAENLGRIPPNTAVMQVVDGKLSYTVPMTSSLDGSATVILHR